MPGARRDLARLPKAHLHLHFTGGMRHRTLVEMADDKGVDLPGALRDGPPPLGPGERSWGRFQRLYDIARSTIRTAGDIERVVGEIAEDDVAAGSGWLELQVDPTSYAPRVGGLVPALETILAAASEASARTGLGIGIIVAANRTRDPRLATTLARLAARHAPWGVVGFGLSNDERAAPAEDFAQAFRIARRAGLLAAPHAGELVGAHSVRASIEHLGASRVGHGVRAVESDETLALMAERSVTAEVCPSSNVALGVAPEPAQVPLRSLLDAGVSVALGADDPLLFGAGLLDQYEVARHHHDLDDTWMAELARMSIRASSAPEPVKAAMLAGVDGWLAEPAGVTGHPPVSPLAGSR